MCVGEVTGALCRGGGEREREWRSWPCVGGRARAPHGADVRIGGGGGGRGVEDGHVARDRVDNGVGAHPAGTIVEVGGEGDEGDKEEDEGGDDDEAGEEEEEDEPDHGKSEWRGDAHDHHLREVLAQRAEDAKRRVDVIRKLRRVVLRGRVGVGRQKGLGVDLLD